MAFLGKGPPLCYHSEASSADPQELGEVFLNIDTVWAKAIVAMGLPLLRKLGLNNCAGARTGTTSSDHPEVCQGTEGDLHNGVPFDSPHT